MNTRIKYTLYAIGGIVVATAGIFYYRVQKLMNNMTFCFNGFRVLSISADKVSFKFKIDITNGSDLSVRLYDEEYLLYVNDKFVSKINATKRTNALLPFQVNTSDYTTQFNPKDLLGSGKGIGATVVDEIKSQLGKLSLDSLTNPKQALKDTIGGIQGKLLDTKIEIKVKARADIGMLVYQKVTTNIVYTLREITSLSKDTESGVKSKCPKRKLSSYYLSA